MLVRVFQIPPPTGAFCFEGGNLAAFTEIDWFRDDELAHLEREAYIAAMTNFLMHKQYYREGVPILILHPLHSFTLNYEAP